MTKAIARAGWFLMGGGLLVFSVSCRGPAEVAAGYGDYDPKHPPQSLNLSGSLQVHDPAVIRGHDRFWVYGSGNGLTVKSSADLLVWRDEPAVFDQNPSWVAELVPDASALWSPSLAYFGSQLHLYYAASTFGSNQSCIGHATGNAPGEAFEDQGSVICSNMAGETNDFNAIDPSVILEHGTEPWLVFGSYGSGIQLIALEPSGARKSSELIALAQRAADNPALQQPTIYRWRDYYYLFVSFDQCCQGVDSTHNIRVGRAAELQGPYLDRDGVDMRAGGGTLVLQGNDEWRGPGSNQIFDDSGRRLNVYHAYDARNDGQETLRIAEIAFDDAGWPVAGGP